MTPEQCQKIKDRFKRNGMTITAFARQKGFSKHLVSQVLNGQVKGHYGKAHEIAKALGLK